MVADTYNGWKQFSHGGADAGYRTYLSVFPDLKMGFIVFSNVGDFDAGGKAYEIADLFIKDSTQKKDAATKDKKDSSAAILKDSLSMKKFIGNYISDDGLQMSFEIREGKLYNHVFGQKLLLIKGQKDT